MDRQTLDMEGARQGELSAASLQLGDDTIAVQRIATMSIESVEFFPWDTPANRKVQSLYASFFVLNLFFGILALAWGGLFPSQPSSMMALVIGGALTVLALILGLRAVMIALRLKRRELYHRLVIGTSDGRQIPLVDNNRDVLTRIRDVVRHKMDTDDRQIVGDFDLDLDIVNLKLPPEAERKARPLSVKITRPDPALPERPGTSPDSEDRAAAEAEVLFDAEPEPVKSAS